ncbi:hypothetical protein JHK82_033434 [Glycine max]|nr:hypothetical protein JHK82_033434 [Glycine max]
MPLEIVKLRWLIRNVTPSPPLECTETEVTKASVSPLPMATPSEKAALPHLDVSPVKQTWRFKVRVLWLWEMSPLSESTKAFAIEMVLMDSELTRSYYHGMRYLAIVSNDPDTHDDFKPTNKLENSNISLAHVIEQDNPTCCDLHERFA